jgi:hypothetical protein
LDKGIEKTIVESILVYEARNNSYGQVYATVNNIITNLVSI